MSVILAVSFENEKCSENRDILCKGMILESKTTTIGSIL